MMKKEKTAALLLGITMNLTGTALAAPADTAQDIDSRIAALEQQQSNLEKEIKELRHQNSQLKNQERSQKKQLNGLSKSVKSEMDRIKISGFGRVSWDNDNIKGYIDRNDNRRFYLDLKGKFKVNDDWNFNFESETNPRYANYVMADGTLKSHSGHDDEDGTIQRVWAEGKTGVVNYDIGRRWRGLGFQNVLFGNESDGVIVSTAIPKSKLTANAFYLTPTDKGYNFSIYGAGVQGQVGHGLQINAAIAKLNIGKHESMGQNVYDTTKTFKVEGVNATIKDLHGTLKGGGDFRWYGSKSGDSSYGDFNSEPGFSIYYTPGLSGKIDASGTYTVTETPSELPNTAGNLGFVLSAMWNPMKNIFLIGDYARTNAPSYTVGEWGANGYQETKYDKNSCTALRFNYRWSNINDPGSFQLYARWYNYARNINNLVGIFGDKEWGALQPGLKGWIFGFKYVPAKNIEWETFYEYANAQNTLYGHKGETYHRNFLRTMVDYHF